MSKFEREEALTSSYQEKRSKGKPQILYKAYHDICKNMVHKNMEDIENAETEEEKKRIRNLNNSILQRLKKRKEQENEAMSK